MQIITHEKINPALCGKPLKVENGTSRVELLTTEEMAADASGLVHGGFIFGLADYAAMIAVNHPYVVLGGAEVKFLKPVRTGQRVVADAAVEETKGKKQQVRVSAAVGPETVFSGIFTCFVLDRHVLG
ncbi:MAG: hotdog domain-containing protein [Desulfobacterales bacterium]